VENVPQLRVFVPVVIVLVVGVCILVGIVRKWSSGSNAKVQSVGTPQVKKTPQAKAQLALPLCPQAGHTPLQPSQQGTGHHKVTLSWKASTPGTNAESNAIGYCLYRSKTRNVAKQNPTCGHCEQINQVPIADTSCVDDLVEDGASYYYVVSAINAKGTISGASNEAPAPIPADRQTVFLHSGFSRPAACRGGAGAR
jgi:hypothetical protein